MNTITLLPNHSKSWCLSPGIFLFFDQVEIDSMDLSRINEPKSSFDAIARDNFLRLTTDESFKIIPTKLDSINPAHENSLSSAKLELLQLFQSFPLRKNSGIITHSEIRDALIHSYSIFFKYNKWKISFLNPDENLFGELKRYRFKEWSGYLNSLKKIKISDFYTWLNNNLQLWNVALNLISVSRNLINSLRQGKSIYDPLYEEFRPWINILIKKDIFEYSRQSELSFIETDNLLQIEFNRLTPNSTNEFSFSELLKIRKKLHALRHLLGEQKTIWNDLVTTKAVSAEKELKKISSIISKSSKSVPWLCYGLCSIVSLPLIASQFESDYIPYVIAALLGIPVISSKLETQIKKYSNNFYSAPNSVSFNNFGFINLVDRVSLNNLDVEKSFKEGIINFWTKY